MKKIFILSFLFVSFFIKLNAETVNLENKTATIVDFTIDKSVKQDLTGSSVSIILETTLTQSIKIVDRKLVKNAKEAFL